MTQEDKKLLLADLCARLPYGVVCYNSNTENNFKLCDTADIDSGYPTFDYGYGELETVKPFLRPISSMTEEEYKEFNGQIYKAKPYSDGKSYNVYEVTGLNIDWLNSHHFDYRGLIEKGLAIEVTESNNPYEN